MSPFQPRIEKFRGKKFREGSAKLLTESHPCRALRLQIPIYQWPLSLAFISPCALTWKLTLPCLAPCLSEKGLFNHLAPFHRVMRRQRLLCFWVHDSGLLLEDIRGTQKHLAWQSLKKAYRGAREKGRRRIRQLHLRMKSNTILPLDKLP